SPRLLLYIHGFSNDSRIVAGRTRTFPRAFLRDTLENAQEPGIGAWVTYDWPGEKSFGAKTVDLDLGTVGELYLYLVLWMLFLLPALILGAICGLRLLEPWFDFSVVASYHFGGFSRTLQVDSLWLLLRGLLAVLIWPLLFMVLFLRISAYPRDRYMAVHRGVP